MNSIESQAYNLNKSIFAIDNQLITHYVKLES